MLLHAERWMDAYLPCSFIVHRNGCSVLNYVAFVKFFYLIAPLTLLSTNGFQSVTRPVHIELVQSFNRKVNGDHNQKKCHISYHSDYLVYGAVYMSKNNLNCRHRKAFLSSFQVHETM